MTKGLLLQAYRRSFAALVQARHALPVPPVQRLAVPPCVKLYGCLERAILTCRRIASRPKHSGVRQM